MFVHGNHFVVFKRYTAIKTDNTFGITFILACGLFTGDYFFLMTVCGNHSGLFEHFTAVCAIGIFCVAILFAGGVITGSYTFFVSKRGDDFLCYKYLVTLGTINALSIAFRFTSGLYIRSGHIIVVAHGLHDCIKRIRTKHLYCYNARISQYFGFAVFPATKFIPFLGNVGMERYPASVCNVGFTAAVAEYTADNIDFVYGGINGCIYGIAIANGYFAGRRGGYHVALIILPRAEKISVGVRRRDKSNLVAFKIKTACSTVCKHTAVYLYLIEGGICKSVDVVS